MSPNPGMTLRVQIHLELNITVLVMCLFTNKGRHRRKNFPTCDLGRGLGLLPRLASKLPAHNAGPSNEQVVELLKGLISGVNTSVFEKPSLHLDPEFF